MENRAPTVSVIIPAYNQAKFLRDAIESVVCQTYQDYEIIVVDDGSTDDTALIVAQYAKRIHYIFQENRGLAGARNTGIRNAQGQYIALLDSDDMWMPDFLMKMMALVVKDPGAIVYYCSAQYCDAEGHELPQIIVCDQIPVETMYESLAVANFIIPSTVVMLKSAILDIGLFDPSFRACEDWDLWLRIAPIGHFSCIRDCLIKYRLHGSSLSADPGKMQKAVRAVIEKHFGTEDDESGNWPRLKRLAYGGVYRYHAWTSVLRQNNWDACAVFLGKALQANPVISTEINFFYDLAMGSQPLGFRGTPQNLDLKTNAILIEKMLSQVFTDSKCSNNRLLRVQTYGTAYFALGLVAYNTGNFSLCRHFLFSALRFRPDLIGDMRVSGNILKSFLGPKMLNWLRKIRGKLS
jgi:glycosyltransferase involved in cell wall biosynthesis